MATTKGRCALALLALIGCKSSETKTSDEPAKAEKPTGPGRKKGDGEAAKPRDRVREESPWLAVPLATAVPDDELPDGTLALHVRGEDRIPADDVTVKLTVDGTERRATTDRLGFAVLRDLKAGAAVKGSASPNRAGTIPPFTMPAHGGIRVRLSTVDPTHAWSAPPSRSPSGHAYTADDLAPGELEVRLARVNDRVPPEPQEVVLVAYKGDERVVAIRSTSSAAGVAHFAGLDTTGATAYYAIVRLPRSAGSTVTDRLVGLAVPGRGAGLRMALIGEAPGAPLAPLEIDQGDPLKPAEAGKLRVAIENAPADVQFEVLVANTGTPVAKGSAPSGKGATWVDVKEPAGTVLFVEGRSGAQRVRSRPFIVDDHRGASAQLWFEERTRMAFRANTAADDDVLRVGWHLQVTNSSWTPFRLAVVLPLPRGARDVSVDGVEGVRWSAAGIELTRPLPPGGLSFMVGFELPARQREVAWSQELPLGAAASQVILEKVPGARLELPAGIKVTEREAKSGITYFLAEDIEVAANKSFELTVHLPPPRPDVEVRRACRGLVPGKSKLLDKPAPTFELPDVRDGDRVKLSSLRGKVVLVNFTASWNAALREKEMPALVELARKKLPGLAIVVVASEQSPKDMAPKVSDVPFPVLFDKPPNSDVNIGEVTASYGINLVPETFLIDRDGIARFYIVNWREWDEADATRCLNALLDEK